jgi:ABC-type transport system involved in cytochrome c biogenesis permease subunit
MRYILHLCLTCLVLLAAAAPVLATEHATPPPLPKAQLKTIPVQHEGRIQPLDTLARTYLTRFSGNDHLRGTSAINFLAKMLFDPASAATSPVFSVRNIALKQKLGLDAQRSLFSLEEVQQIPEALREAVEQLQQTDPQDYTNEQQDFLTLYNNIASMLDLMRSFSLVLPLDVQTPDQYAQKITAAPPHSYIDLLPHLPRIMQDMENIVRRKGQDLERYSESETQTAKLAFALQLIQAGGQDNTLLAVIPPDAAYSQTPDTWLAPWGLINSGQGSPQTLGHIENWREAARAYRAHDAGTWKKSLAALNHLSAQNPQTSPVKIKLEVLYNFIAPFHVALALYALAALCFCAAFFKAHTALKIAALFALSSGASLHFVALASRVFLLDRAPVGTLYESVIFVSFICALFALSSYARTRNYAAILSGTIAAASLLVIAPFLIKQGQSMEMLVAVLNTNFWLSVHVLCITAGYGVCIMAACMAHIYLWQRWRRGNGEAGLIKLQTSIYKTSLLALLLTAVGTALGGVWADQSWGRFWGWDPKENGALLIVLWLIWAQHGRHAGRLRPLPFAAAMAYLNVIVALAWFGVNLLETGLHSYGFISGIAEALFAFWIIETLLIAAAWIAIRHREKREPQHEKA